MESMLMVNGPIRKFVQQDCNCKPENSYCISKTRFQKSEFVEGSQNVLIEYLMDVCSNCDKPYKVWFDVSNCVLIKNIGDSNG